MTVYPIFLMTPFFIILASSGPFYELQVLNLPNSAPRSFEMSNDNRILVIANNNNETEIYFQNENLSYSLHQTITNNSDYTDVVDITADGEMLLAIERNGNIKIFQND